MNGEPAVEAGAPHPLVLLVSAVFWVFLWLLSWMKSLTAFATISVPKFIYAVLSYSLTLTLNFWSFAIIFLLSAIALNYWIRFRYLNTYATLKEPPLVKPDAKELHPDVNASEEPHSFHNYLDEFLQAVRVFGFLEKPVFHELARHLQTRRLIAGDSLYLDQDKSFYCVVDGLVQVYAKSDNADHDHNGWEGDDTNGYQLLNEVGSGGTLSSLFTILSLFTEDVQISWQDEEEAETFSDATSTTSRRPVRSPLQRVDSDVSHLQLDSNGIGHPRRPSVSSSSGTAQPDEHEPNGSPRGRNSVSSRSRPNTRATSFARTSSAFGKVRRPTRPDLQGTVARAVEDTTLAVIPAEAFKRLTKKFPKASAHIVQVILTRFSRVTFNVAHKYLGLTSEVLRTEKAINDIACHPLPSWFYETGGLQHLRQRFDRQVEKEHEDNSPEYVSRGSDESLEGEKNILREPSLADSPGPIYKTPASLARAPSYRQYVQAGDLHTTAGNLDIYRPISRSYSYLRKNQTLNPSSHHQSDGLGLAHVSGDEFSLQDEVMSCIAKSIGLLQPPMGGTESPDASPKFAPSETGSWTRPPSFSSFGSLSLLETGDDTSSITGESSTLGSTTTAFDNEVEILFFSAGSTLARAGERNTGLFYVIDGFLDISLPLENVEKVAKQRVEKTEKEDQPDVTPRPPLAHLPSLFASKGTRQTPVGPSNKTHKHLFTVKRGGIAGYLASLCSTASYVDITAKTDTYVGYLPYTALERLLEKQPIVLLTLAKRLISLLSPLVLHIDASLDWTQVNAGQVLWRAGEPSDSFYIVINGRLRAIQENGGAVSISAEYGQGDSVGELEVITSRPRIHTVHAIRDSEVVRMPVTLFNAISARNPRTTAKLLRTIASRVRDEVDSSIPAQPIIASELGRSNLNLKTVAILPVSRSVPIEIFSKKLHTALEGIGAPTAYLNQASVSSHLGRHAFTRMGKLKVAGWLADQEERYQIVLYVADSPVSSPWTQTCIRQADFVLIVGSGEAPELGEYERLLLSMKTTARKELVILHSSRSIIPGSTREWLKSRPWIHQHIHVELPGLAVSATKAPHHVQDPAAVVALKNLKDKVQSEIQKYRGGRDAPRAERPPHMDDFSRLARRICGRSIGVVLGGGGARGMGHLGVLRALEEFGIPVDHIGGTSIGAFVGGLYAKEGDYVSAAGRVKQFSGRMGNIWRLLSDVTYPIVAYTTGHEFNRAIYKAFFDLHIEDMWLPFFCNTTNILTSRMEIHDTGYAWRFIRGSMTLVGLLPPLCDNGRMLVDGGYLDNLPVSAMVNKGVRAVFASDVGSLDDNSPRTFGDSVSGWWLLINRWNPFSATRNIPAIPEIQSRLAYVSSVRTLEEAKNTRGCLYMQIPVQEYGTLQFGKFDEIQERGYTAALELLEKFDKESLLPPALSGGDELSSKTKKRGRSLRRNSI